MVYIARKSTGHHRPGSSAGGQVHIAGDVSESAGRRVGNFGGSQGGIYLNQTRSVIASS